MNEADIYCNHCGANYLTSFPAMHSRGCPNYKGDVVHTIDIPATMNITGAFELGLKAAAESNEIVQFHFNQFMLQVTPSDTMEGLMKHWDTLVRQDAAKRVNRSILQDWVMQLGLRHQGVLVSSVRGCDTVARHDPIKLLCRCLRAVLLVTHCSDPAKSKSYIETVSEAELEARMSSVIKDHDALPHHYLMHLIHAAEIIGYKYPDERLRYQWYRFYAAMCNKLHTNVETEDQLDDRLNADEETFAARQ